MKNRIKYFAVALASSAIAFATPVEAAVNLVTNGSFTDITSTGKDRFLNHVTGWSGGSNLTFIDTPGTADDGSYLSVYGPFPKTSPDGGNFVEADGDPSYRSAIYQRIDNLVVGAAYDLTFYQAAGQQVNFTGPTTERWAVFFGGSNMTLADAVYSDMYSLPQGGVGPWLKQTMHFTAKAATQYLGFLADGTPNGAPPISFLDGVSLTAAVPEPSTWATMVIGFGVLGGALRRKRQALAHA